MNLWSCQKDVKPVVYDMERGMAMEPMKGNRASSQVDLGYIEISHLSAVTSVFFWTCDSVLGDSLEFHQANQGSL